MSIRHVLRTVAISARAALCGGALALGVGVGAASADISNGTTTLSATGPVTAGTPYTSGQTIEIKGVANSTLSNANLVANSVPGQDDGEPHRRLLLRRVHGRGRHCGRSPDHVEWLRGSDRRLHLGAEDIRWFVRRPVVHGL